MGKQRESRRDVAEPQETLCVRTEVRGSLGSLGSTAAQLFVLVGAKSVLRLTVLRACNNPADIY